MEDVWRGSLMETDSPGKTTFVKLIFAMPSLSSADASWRLNFSASLLSIGLCFHSVPVPWKHESYSL